VDNRRQYVVVAAVAVTCHFDVAWLTVLGGLAAPGHDHQGVATAADACRYGKAPRSTTTASAARTAANTSAAGMPVGSNRSGNSRPSDIAPT
jgi:hypothetical protein